MPLTACLLDVSGKHVQLAGGRSSVEFLGRLCTLFPSPAPSKPGHRIRYQVCAGGTIQVTLSVCFLAEYNSR
ncbi:hypothetical protein X975_26527, partial [Stegodyphus mimosarum]